MLFRKQGMYLMGLGGLLLSSCPAREPPQEKVYIKAIVINSTNRDDVLLVDHNSQAEKQYEALAVFSDEHIERYTDKVHFETDNRLAGGFNGSVWKSAALEAPNVLFSELRAVLNDGGRILHGSHQLTTIWLHKSGPKPDVYFRLPYESYDSKVVTFTTRFQRLDAFLAVDTTDQTRNGYEIQALSGSLASSDGIFEKLRGVVVPEQAERPSTLFGLGAIDDYPILPHGIRIPCALRALDGAPRPDQPFTLLLPMTADKNALLEASGKLIFERYPRGCGSDPGIMTADAPQSQLDALRQIATGSGINIPSEFVDVPAHSSDSVIGGVEFRKGSLPVVLLSTDAAFHEPEETHPSTRRCQTQSLEYYETSIKLVAATWMQTTTALNGIFGKVIGLSTTRALAEESCQATQDLLRVAMSTDTTVPPSAWGEGTARPSGCAEGKCCSGIGGAPVEPQRAADGQPSCPLVYLINGDNSGAESKARDLPARLFDAVSRLVNYSSFDLLVNAQGAPLNDGSGKSTASLIEKIEPEPGNVIASPKPVQVTPLARPDGYSNVVPGSVVGFTVHVRNSFIHGGPTPKVFYAKLRAHAGSLGAARQRDCFEKERGCADLDERLVVILVPPETPK